jgi:phosphomevalonate kinase
MSEPPARVWTAPGKAFLLGEYAVLEGAPAVVAAVTCRARAWYEAGARAGSPLTEEVARATAAAQSPEERSNAERDRAAGSVLVDTDAFHDGAGRKLGTGSSAAVAAAATAVWLDRASHQRTGCGFDTTAEDARDYLCRLADDAHRRWQGGVGSGADVAAAIHGGLIQFSRPPAAAAVIEPLRAPLELTLVFFAAGSSASTVALVSEVKAFAKAAPDAYARHVAELHELASRGAAALRAAEATAFIAAVAGYGQALGALGRDAGAPIVLPTFAAAGTLAIALGGAAKPSGAGGGDIGVAAFADAAASRTFAARLPKLGLIPLPLGLDLAGTSPLSPCLDEKTRHD